MKVLEESIGVVCCNEALQVLQQRGAHRQGSQRKALPSECQARPSTKLRRKHTSALLLLLLLHMFRELQFWPMPVVK